MPLTAPSVIGSTENNGSTTIAISPSRDIQVGEFIVITLTERDWGISTLADNSSQAGTANTYTQDRFNNLTFDSFTYIYSCKVTRKILASNTITATFNGGSGVKSLCAYVLPNANATSQLDSAGLIRGSGTGGSGFDSTASGTTAQADEYFIGVAAYSESSDADATITASAPWTLQYSGHGGGGNGYGHAHMTQVTTATGSVRAQGTWGTQTGSPWSASGASYKGTVSSATPTYNNDGSLVVTGNPAVGSVLTANHGNWTPTPTSYAYRWLRSNDNIGTGEADIAGATGPTYTLAVADLGKYIRVGVTAS